MALLVPLLKPNYTLYAANKPSPIYGLVQPSPYYSNSPSARNTGSNHCYNLTNVVQPKSTPNNNIILSSNKVKQTITYSTPAKNNTNSTGGKSKTPTTIVVNGNIIYSAGTYSGKYVLPPGLLLAPTLNSSCASNGGGARRFRSLSERSRVITPMPIIFENERLGSGPEMLFHPHTAPPVRKTRKSKSLPSSDSDQQQQQAASVKNGKDGASIRKWFFTKPVTFSGLATTFAGKTATANNSASATTAACSCQACLCSCNSTRRAGKRRKCQGGADKQPKHRHRTTCDKGDPNVKSGVGAECKPAHPTTLDVNNNHTRKQSSPEFLMEPGTACTVDDDLTLLCPPAPRGTGRRKLSCGSNSSTGYDSGPGTPSPSPPNRSPLNSEIALAGKFAFAQLYHNHAAAAKQHRKSHSTTAQNTNHNSFSNNNSKMVMLLRSLSGKLTLKHKDGTPLGEDLLNDPSLNDITITNNSGITTQTLLKAEPRNNNNPTLPATMSSLGLSLNLLTPAVTSSNNSSNASPAIPFFKRFRTISR